MSYACPFGARSFPEMRLSTPNLSPKISQNGQTVLEIFKFEELRNMKIKQVDKHYNVINNSCSWIINEIFVENAY